MHTQHWTRIGSWEKWCASSWMKLWPKKWNCIGNQVRRKKVTIRGRRGRERKRQTIRSYVYTMLRVLDWIGLPRQQNKHSKPRCGSASPSSCFKLKLHFPVYVRPVTSRTVSFSLSRLHPHRERKRDIALINSIGELKAARAPLILSYSLPLCVQST